MSATGPGPAPGGGPAPSEEELRAAYEAEIKKIRVEQVLLEQVVTLVNLGMRRTGLAPGTEDERDAPQVRLAIEAIRGLLPLIEQVAPAQSGPIRDALSQLQLAYVRIGGEPSAEGVGGAAGAQGAPGAPHGAPHGAPGAGQGARGAGTGQGPPGGGGGQGAGAGGAAQGPPASEEQPPNPGEPGPAQRSGRLWVPGQ